MFTYIYNGETHTDTSPDYMTALGMSDEARESVLNQLAYEESVKSCSIRAERDKRITATDFYLLPDAPTQPAGLASYRQALRDVPQQPGFPWGVEWPVLTE